MSVTGIDLSAELRQQVRGTVAQPGEPAYADLVAGFHLSFEHRPPFVVEPADADDVAAVVAVARRAGVPVTALGAGHGFHFAITEGIVVKTRSLSGVDVDPEAATARIGAGTSWQEVLDVSAAHGLVPLSGSDAGVGAVGYVLGGGLGPYGRTYGYAADSVVSFRVVTGEGRVVTVDEQQHADLFWALRGGNHGLGIVTEMTVRLVPSTNIHGHAWYYDAADVEAVLRAWVRWTADLPREMNSYAQIKRMPEDPEVPEPLRGRATLELMHVYIGEQADGERLIAPLLEVAPAIHEEPGRVREETLPPVVVSDGGVYLTAVDDEAITAILKLAGPDRSYEEAPLVAVSFQLLGGALADPQASPNAVAGRDARVAFHVIGADPDAIASGENTRQIRALHDVVAPLRASGTIPNYIGPSNTPGAVDVAWSAEPRARLDAVRATYVPARVLRKTHKFEL
jgi:FAD/FMN-containing dehydrogenase